MRTVEGEVAEQLEVPYKAEITPDYPSCVERYGKSEKMSRSQRCWIIVRGETETLDSVLYKWKLKPRGGGQDVNWKMCTFKVMGFLKVWK